ncbi:TetR/AcrR family transcriptional regulator [Marilutibacter alkalisoli]|uniref:TetR/AcrR family transcriptional regulator n=1 Tax=Marilutibacter alkalisoli TaxID=2591633 RepID=A0A514BPV5_9GAMM|nr:TetR/AcrR family transcriptional regulator [Lysobacter alkalisoli]QDH69407.1 TetR/AcrR family transcriptional regulator [Lysobacter alkalisoli]
MSEITNSGKSKRGARTGLARGAKAADGSARNRRAPGRPGVDGPDQRERVLDAAIACYVEHGIAATTLRRIADHAGVNPALLHYYFGDKAQLREAMVNERLLPALAGLRERLARDGNDVAGLVGGFVQGIGVVMAEHPWLPSLWVREVLCEGGALRDVLLERIGPQVPLMMAGRFAEAQRQGRLNADLDPRLLMVSLVGLTMFPIASASLWRSLFDADDLDFEALRAHTLTLLERGLELSAKPPAQGGHEEDA